MPSITSPKGHVALIDEADAYLCEMRWNSHAQGSSPARVYFKRHVWVNGKQVHMSLHRVIMGLMPGDPRKVDDLVRACRHGPLMARVDKLHTEPADYDGIEDFRDETSV